MLTFLIALKERPLEENYLFSPLFRTKVINLVLSVNELMADGKSASSPTRQYNHGLYKPGYLDNSMMSVVRQRAVLHDGDIKWNFMFINTVLQCCSVHAAAGTLLAVSSRACNLQRLFAKFHNHKKTF